MSIQQAQSEVLNFLFTEYLKDEANIFDISPIAQKYRLDVHEFGTLLLDSNLIKNQQYLPRTFECEISMNGIATVSPQYINDNVNKILSTLHTLGEWQSIMEILDFEPKSFQRAFDLAKFLEARNLIETQFTHNDVFIKLTPTGRQQFEEQGPTFF